ncbi:MAG: hypothetical protein ABI834_03700 [Ginsengibacter sp.]
MVLGKEDGFFENLTFIFFVFAVILFFISFLRTKNIFLLGLALLFLFGAGEEISWGQRILHFRTPNSMYDINAQHEFNIHNLEIFNYTNLKKVKKSGLKRLLDFNLLYRIFSMIFLVCIPVFFYHIKTRLITNKKIQMPVAPVTIGIFFFITLVVFYSLKYFILPVTKVQRYYFAITEVFEFTTSYIYFTVALYFYNRKDNKFLGKDIKQTLL